MLFFRIPSPRLWFIPHPFVDLRASGEKPAEEEEEERKEEESGSRGKGRKKEGCGEAQKPSSVGVHFAKMAHPPRKALKAALEASGMRFFELRAMAVGAEISVMILWCFWLSCFFACVSPQWDEASRPTDRTV